MNDIKAIERDILRQVFSRLDSFEQHLLYDGDENDNYYSPDSLVISLSSYEYSLLKESLNGR